MSKFIGQQCDWVTMHSQSVLVSLAAAYQGALISLESMAVVWVGQGIDGWTYRQQLDLATSSFEGPPLAEPLTHTLGRWVAGLQAVDILALCGVLFMGPRRGYPALCCLVHLVSFPHRFNTSVYPCVLTTPWWICRWDFKKPLEQVLICPCLLGGAGQGGVCMHLIQSPISAFSPRMKLNAVA